MSIHIVLGKPGGGKSMYGTYRLIVEALEGKKNIVTNLPLRVDRLNEYLQQTHPDVDCRLVQRLRILADEETKAFWEFRGPATSECVDLLTGDVVTAADAKGSDEGRGVLYLIDEAHIAFNAREWSSIGKQCLWYLSQHRKLGDVVFAITQAAPNLDKQFRSVAQDFTVVKNGYTAKFGAFRARGRFVRKSYNEEPSRASEPFDTGSFVLDKEGLASCYDTARGIGVHGSKADIGTRAKGIPILLIFPLVAVGAILLIAAPVALGKMWVKKISTTAPIQGQMPGWSQGAQPASAVTPHAVVPSSELVYISEFGAQVFVPDVGWIWRRKFIGGGYADTYGDGRRIRPETEAEHRQRVQSYEAEQVTRRDRDALPVVPDRMAMNRPQS